eukprot:TRINITY_DN7606_c0_g1_i2.p1 TRINITY_DN7606_c0_g1~~TRINITY_DN7606_c0_g1_i2.p1  ORF type:complete len:879 (+),score=217.32 TRINITY_DN7606_c0_g1_i2:59-2695(+)
MHPNLRRMLDEFHACDPGRAGVVSDAVFLEQVERTSGRVPAVETLLAQFKSPTYGAGWVDYNAFVAHLGELLGGEGDRAKASPPPQTAVHPAVPRQDTSPAGGPDVHPHHSTSSPVGGDGAWHPPRHRPPPRPLPSSPAQTAAERGGLASSSAAVDKSPGAGNSMGGTATSRQLFHPASNFEEVDIELSSSQHVPQHVPPQAQAQYVQSRAPFTHRVHGTPPRYPTNVASPLPALAAVRSPSQAAESTSSSPALPRRQVQAQLLEPPDNDDERPSVMTMSKRAHAEAQGAGTGRQEQHHRALFEQLDMDCCGVVTYDRLLAYFNSKGRVDEAIYERVFDSVDTKATGFLDYTQFTEFMGMVKPPPAQRGSQGEDPQCGVDAASPPPAQHIPGRGDSVSPPIRGGPVEAPQGGGVTQHEAPQHQAGHASSTSLQMRGAPVDPEAQPHRVRAISEVLAELPAHAGALLQLCNERDAARRGSVPLEELLALCEAALPQHLLPITRHHLAELVRPEARSAVLNDRDPSVDYIDLVTSLMAPASPIATRAPLLQRRPEPSPPHASYTAAPSPSTGRRTSRSPPAAWAAPLADPEPPAPEDDSFAAAELQAERVAAWHSPAPSSSRGVWCGGDAVPRRRGGSVTRPQAAPCPSEAAPALARTTHSAVRLQSPSPRTARGDMAQARRRRANRTVHLALVRVLGTKQEAARRLNAALAAAVKKVPRPSRGEPLPEGYMKAQEFSRVVASLYREQGEEPVRNVVAECVAIGKLPFTDMENPTPFEAAARAAAGALHLQHAVAAQLVDYRFFLAEANLTPNRGSAATRAQSASPRTTRRSPSVRRRSESPARAPTSAAGRYEHTHAPQLDDYHTHLLSQLHNAGLPVP